MKLCRLCGGTGRMAGERLDCKLSNHNVHNVACKKHKESIQWISQCKWSTYSVYGHSITIPSSITANHFKMDQKKLKKEFSFQFIKLNNSTV